MVRTDEAIVTRAAEEHIRQPIPYDDVDSVKVMLAHVKLVKISKILGPLMMMIFIMAT